MNCAFLFNSSHSSLSGFYGHKILEKILSTSVLQSSQRSMRISVGDILPFAYDPETKETRNIGKANAAFENIPEGLRFFNTQAGPITDDMIIYCWIFQNISIDLMMDLHNQLRSDETYHGVLELDFSIQRHLVQFRNNLIEHYRFCGKECSIFYMMHNEDPDLSEKETLEKAGFETSYEDIGGRTSIFDGFNTYDHFCRIEDFRSFMLQLNWPEEQVSQLIYDLEELHPYLFDILFAAVRTHENSEIIEELSQAHLSGRRFIEHLADFLFKEQKEPYKCLDGEYRDVKQSNYTNRIAAYIEQAMKSSGTIEKETLESLGKEIYRLYNDVFCKGVHKPYASNKEFESLKKNQAENFSDLGSWLLKLIELHPTSFRKPYLAYGEHIKDLFSPENQLNMLKAKPDIYKISSSGIELIEEKKL